VGRISSLDGMQGVAVLVVIVHHSACLAGASDRLRSTIVTTATAAGWVGAQLFVVLAGLSITGIPLDSRDQAGYIRSFCIRRTLRIFPLSFAFVAATVTVAMTMA
jgi:peptidoglycan/LPS O-acetylase OafA/YrhL